MNKNFSCLLLIGFFVISCGMGARSGRDSSISKELSVQDEKDPSKTYTIENTMEILGPVDVTQMQTDSQSAELIETKSHSNVVKFTYFPLFDANKQISENFHWQMQPESVQEYLRPGLTINWDQDLRKDVLNELEKIGIRPNELSDKQVVERVSDWLTKPVSLGGTFREDSPFISYYVTFDSGVIKVNQALREIFDREKKLANVDADDDAIERGVSGKGMYFQRTRGSCSSSAILIATVLRAIGIPTRIVVAVPPFDANDTNQINQAQTGLIHHKTRASILAGMSRNEDPNSPMWSNHIYNEVFIGNRWVMLNYNHLGQPIVDKHFLGLMTVVARLSDWSETRLSVNWGTRAATRFLNPEASLNPVMSSLNPYKSFGIFGKFGKDALIDNPEVPEDVKTGHVTSLLWKGSKLIPEGMPLMDNGLATFVLTLSDWIPERDFKQLRGLRDKASREMRLRSVDNEIINLTFLGNSLTDNEGGFQGFQMDIPTEEFAKMKKNVTYKLEVLNQENKEYQWQVGSESALIRTDKEGNTSGSENNPAQNPSL